MEVMGRVVVFVLGRKIDRRRDSSPYSLIFVCGFVIPNNTEVQT